MIAGSGDIVSRVMKKVAKAISYIPINVLMTRLFKHHEPPSSLELVQTPS